jgi:hypothetical protein
MPVELARAASQFADGDRRLAQQRLRRMLEIPDDRNSHDLTSLEKAF